MALARLLCFLLSCIGTSLIAGPLKIDVPAPSVILINADTGAILYEKNAHLLTYPASTTKVATALYALSKKSQVQDLDTLVTVSHDAVAIVPPQIRRAANSKHLPYRLEYGGTSMRIKAGEQLPFRSLIYGLMLVSGNDAANAIAEHVCGSVPQFVEEMNAFLKEIGCLETTFHTPHGLPHPDHKTSAYDLAKMTQVALKNPFFREVVKTARCKKPATNKGPESFMDQHNQLLKPGRHHYPKAIGVKIGWTVSSGFNIVAAAEDENRKLIAVVLNCTDAAKSYKSATALFEAAFSEPRASRTLFTKGYDLFSHVLKDAKTPLEAALIEDLMISYYPSEEPELKAFLHWHQVQLPIVKGALVGEIQIKMPDGKILKTASLYASKEVPATSWYKFTQSFKRAQSLLFAEWKKILIVVCLLNLLVLLYFLRKESSKQDIERAQ